jgi:hypothetical protein
MPTNGAYARGKRVPKVSTGLRKTLKTVNVSNNQRKRPSNGGADPFEKYRTTPKKRSENETADRFLPKKRAIKPRVRGMIPITVIMSFEYNPVHVTWLALSV